VTLAPTHELPPLPARTTVRRCLWCRAITVYPGADLPIVMGIMQNDQYATSRLGEIQIKDGICEKCGQEQKEKQTGPKLAHK